MKYNFHIYEEETTDVYFKLERESNRINLIACDNKGNRFANGAVLCIIDKNVYTYRNCVCGLEVGNDGNVVVKDYEDYEDKF